MVFSPIKNPRDKGNTTTILKVPCRPTKTILKATGQRKLQYNIKSPMQRNLLIFFFYTKNVEFELK